MLRSPRQSALYREAPIVYTFDDHDYGGDDADGTSVTKVRRSASTASGCPHYPLPLSAVAGRRPGAGPLGPVAHTFTIGRARVIVTDTRSDRTPRDAADAATRTMLGKPQRQWFVDGSTRAADEKVPVVFWANTVPWITKEYPTSGHGWAPARERAGIAGHHLEAGPDVAPDHVSGDAHMAANRQRHEQQLRRGTIRRRAASS